MATAISVKATGNPEIDGLLSGSAWTGTITYSFPASSSVYVAGYGDGEPTAPGFSPAPVAMQQATAYAVALISSYTNAVIVFNGTGGADIAVAQSSSANPASYAYYPGNYPEGGDVWFGTSYDYSGAALGNYFFATAIHELGHSFGLKHSQETGGVANVAVPAGHDDLEYGHELSQLRRRISHKRLYQRSIWLSANLYGERHSRAANDVWRELQHS